MASVLKSKSLPPGANTAQTEVFNWEDVAAKGRDYIESIRAEARKIIADCQLECQTLKAQAREEGLQAGEGHVERLAQRMATELSEQRVSDAARTIKTVCEDLESVTQDWLRQWQHETVRLAIAIAEKLVARQVETDPTILLNWIEDSVRMVLGQRQITLKLHSEDAARISSILPELLEQINPSMELQVVEDDSIGRSSVVLQTPDTTIDRSLAKQLSRLRQELE